MDQAANVQPICSLDERRTFYVAVTGILPILVLFQLANYIILILIISSGRDDVDTSSPVFAMYKNSGFMDCASSSPVHVNCSMVYGYDLDSYIFGNWGAEHNGSFLNELDYNYVGPNANLSYTWCELASCLKGFKVIPSSPLPSAFRYTNMAMWCYVNLMAISITWGSRQRLKIENPENHNEEWCEKNVGFWDWFFLLYTLCCIIFWWRSYSLVAAHPYQGAAISITTWFATWNLAFSMQCHPWSCWFNWLPGWRTPIKWVLSIFAIIHWIATLHFLNIRWGDLRIVDWQGDLFPRYDCLESQISNSTGTSLCSPEKLCAKTWLFSDPGFGLSGNDLIESVWIFYMFVFFLLSFAAWLPSLYIIGRRFWNILDDGDPLTPREKAKEVVILSFAVGACVGLFLLFILTIGIGVLAYIADHWKSWDTAATVTYDMECEAVHVALNPWMQYLDVKGVGFPLRVVNLLFNA